MQAKEPEQPGAHHNWGRTAAQISIAVAILAWLIGQAFKGTPVSATLLQVKVYAEVVCMALYIGGATAALIALCAIRKFGPQGIVVTACFGVFLNIGYLHVITWANPEVLHARQTKPSPRVEHSQQQLGTQPHATVDYEGLEFHRLEDALERASEVAFRETPEDKAVRKAWRETLIHWKELRAKVEVAEQLLVAADVFSPSVASKEDFTRRRQLADGWFTAAMLWERELEALRSRYEANLRQASVTPKRHEIELQRLAVGTEIAGKIALAHCAAQKEVAVHVNHLINALEAEFPGSSVGDAGSGSFQVRPGSHAWKERCEKLSEAIRMLQTLRLELGLPPPNLRIPSAAPAGKPDVLL